MSTEPVLIPLSPLWAECGEHTPLQTKHFPKASASSQGLSSTASQVHTLSRKKKSPPTPLIGNPTTQGLTWIQRPICFTKHMAQQRQIDWNWECEQGEHGPTHHPSESFPRHLLLHRVTSRPPEAAASVCLWRCVEWINREKGMRLDVVELSS